MNTKTANEHQYNIKNARPSGQFIPENVAFMANKMLVIPEGGMKNKV